MRLDHNQKASKSNNWHRLKGFSWHGQGLGCQLCFWPPSTGLLPLFIYEFALPWNLFSCNQSPKSLLLSHNESPLSCFLWWSLPRGTYFFHHIYTINICDSIAGVHLIIDNLGILKVSSSEPEPGGYSLLAAVSVSNHPSKKTRLLAVTVKHQVWKNPSPPPLLFMWEFIYSQHAPTCKTISHSAFTTTSCVIFAAAKQASDAKKDLHGDEENSYLPPKMRWGFMELTCADFGEQQQSLSSKELQGQRERRLWMLQRKEQHRSETEAAYWGRPAEEAVFSPHTGHQAGLQFSPVSHQFPTRSLFLLRRVRQQKKKPNIPSSKILFDPSWTVDKGQFWPANRQGLETET